MDFYLCNLIIGFPLTAVIKVKFLMIFYIKFIKNIKVLNKLICDIYEFIENL